MMKKLAKAMLLAAATAFLLAGFSACSSGADDPTLNPTLKGIKVSKSEVKTTYTVGEELDLTGIRVTAIYDDGGMEDVTDVATDFKAIYNDKDFTPATAGDFEVTLTATYRGKTGSGPCTIVVKPLPPTLMDIEIDIDESGLKYTVNEPVKHKGITVTATYSDDSTEDVTTATGTTIDMTCNGAPFTTEADGEFDVTITASYGGKTKTVTRKIKVEGTPGGGGETTYTLDIANFPTTVTGTTQEIDSTVTVISTAKDSQSKDKSIAGKGTYVQMTGGAAAADYGLQLTLAKNATITAKATTKTTGKTLMLLDSASNNKREASKIIDSTTTNVSDAVEITFENVAAGTYMFGSSSGGCYLFSLVIEYK